MEFALVVKMSHLHKHMLNIVDNTPKEVRQLKYKLADLHCDYMAIFKTQSTSYKTDDMMLEILSQLEKIEGLNVEFDEYNNLYVTKGKLAENEAYPIFVCHTDTVHKIYDVPVHVEISNKGNFFAYVEQNNEFMQVGVGGDDKCGIIACIELLFRLKKVKCVFFKDEEVGCKGSSVADMNFFKDGRFAIQIDRKGSGDIITSGSGTELCSQNFENILAEVGKTYGYKPTWGATTDVVQLKKKGLAISAVNLSAGYYHPHTKQEFVNVYDFLNCFEFCMAISRFKNVFPHTLPPPKIYKKEDSKSNYSHSGYNAFGRPVKNDNRRAIALEKCKDCGKLLGLDEGMVCHLCLRGWFEDSFLSENTETGEVTLICVPDAVDDQQKLPSGYEQWLPSEHCLPCETNNLKKTRLETNVQKERGYCDNCLNCSICGKKLNNGNEISIGTHIEHATITQLEYCSNPSCTNLLGSDVEKMNKICTQCGEISYNI